MSNPNPSLKHKPPCLVFGPAVYLVSYPLREYVNKKIKKNDRQKKKGKET